MGDAVNRHARDLQVRRARRLAVEGQHAYTAPEVPFAHMGAATWNAPPPESIFVPSRARRARRQATVEGRRAVLETLRAGSSVHRILLSETAKQGPQIAEIIALAGAAGVLVEAVPREVLDRTTLTRRHQGVIALVPDPSYVAVDDLLARVRASGSPALIAVLDGIEDPQNFGAIARTVDAAGGHGVVIPARRAASITPGAVRASAGALEYVPVARVVNLPRALDALKRAGVWTVGLDQDADTVYTDVDFKLSTAIVVGGENRGISRLVRERCDILAAIPLLGELASLNASVAASIALYEAVRQRAGGAERP